MFEYGFFALFAVYVWMFGGLGMLVCDTCCWDIRLGFCCAFWVGLGLLVLGG